MNSHSPGTRNLFFFIVVLWLCNGCSQKPAFKTPNDLTKIQATVHLNNGTIVKGLLSVYFENEMMDGRIELLPEGSVTKQQLSIKDVSFYTIDSNTYVPKAVDLYTMGTNHFLFVKRLTRDTDRMQLYELHQLYKSNETGEENYYYFFSFPYFSKYEVVETNSNKVTPFFEMKMSHYVEDCPALAEKIRNRNKSFYYGAVSLRSKREEVIKNIVKEYNACR